MSLLQIIISIVQFFSRHIWKEYTHAQAQPKEVAPAPVLSVPASTPDAVSPEPEQPKHAPRFCWCLDNGHGSLQAGKRSPVTADGRQLLEYEFNRDIVARIIKQLDVIGVRYFNVVPEVAVGSDLPLRTTRANDHDSDYLPKIFVSIHANAGPTGPGEWTVANGVETWFRHADAKSQAMAEVFQRHLIEKTGLRNRYTKSREENEFYVLRHTNMPAILTENGFYNNWKELELLFTDDMRQRIADAHVAAILECEKS